MYRVSIHNGNQETVIHSDKFNDIKLESGSIKQGINTADSFIFSILPFNRGYNQLFPLKTLIKIKNTLTNHYEFEGRILSPTENMEESGAFSKSYVCESELGYLNDSRQRHGEYHDITVRGFLQVIIDNHNADVADDPIDKTFEVGIVDVDSTTGTLYRYLGYEKTFDAIDDKLIKRLGGELRVRKENGVRYIDYVQSIGEHKTTEIKLSKNLKTITKEVDPTKIVTRLIPLGERIESEDEEATDASEARLTIESVNGGKDYIVDEAMEQALGTIIYGSETWDDITQPNILKTRGDQWLVENNRIKAQHKLSALDLSIIGIDPDAYVVGNWYPVVNPVMEIDESLRVIQKTIDIIEAENNDLTIGDKFLTASEYQNESNKSARKVIDLENIVDGQSKTIATIKSEINKVEVNLVDLQQAIENADLEDLPDAISALEQAINSLNDALDGIPVYDLATPTRDGLMASIDKVKLDALEVYQEATEVMAGLMSADDKQKLNRITVNQNIDLDDVLTRLYNLENPQDL